MVIMKRMQRSVSRLLALAIVSLALVAGAAGMAQAKATVTITVLYYYGPFACQRIDNPSGTHYGWNPDFASEFLPPCGP